VHAVHQAALWSQFGAALEMLGNAITACPEELWSDRERQPEFWYLAFHTLFFLDYYLADSEAEFSPPAPFTLDELDPAGILPDRVYSREELGEYLRHGRALCRRVIAETTEARMREECGFPRRSMNRWELLLYNLRHVQHHAAQLNLILRERTRSAPEWVGGSRDPLHPAGADEL
jgi:hypothetical protein